MGVVIAIVCVVFVFGALVSNSGDTATVWSAGDDVDDWMHSSFGVGGIVSDDDFLSNDDIYYSPIYSHLACNIYHDPFADEDSWSSSDDDFCSCSSFDDDGIGCGCSSFDDDGIGCGCGIGWDD